MSKNTSYVASLLFIALVSVPNVSFAYGLKHTSHGNLVRWQKRSITLRVDPALEHMLDAGQVRAAVGIASDAWRGFGAAPEIKVDTAVPPPVYDANRRGNGIYLLEKWPFDSKQLAVTVETFSQDGEILGVDVLVNGEKSFAMFNEGQALVASDRYDLAAVLTHEFGHVLGLDESYQHPEATMYPQIHAGESRQRLLSEDDQQGVTAVYSAALKATAAPAAGCSVVEPRTANGSHGLGAGVLGLVGLVAGRSLRRQRRAA